MRGIRTPVFFLFAIALAVSAVPARANGWEHWGIPLEVLLKALASDQPEHQVAAGRSLGYRRETSAIAPMLELIGRAETPATVTSAILDALGRIGDSRALPALHRVLQESPREELRADAATALGAIGAAESRAQLLIALRREPTLVGRAAIVSALGAWRDAEAIAALAALLDDPRHRALRPRAIQALGRMGSPAAPPLLSALQTARSDGARIEIVDALGRTGAPEAVGRLSALLSPSASPELRVRVAAALGAIGDGSAVPTLIALLSDEAAPVRYYAVRSLAEANDIRAAEPLRQLFARLVASPAPADSAQHLADLTLQIDIVSALIETDAPGSLALFASALAPREFPRDSALGLRLNQGVYELRRAATVGLGYSNSTAAGPLLVDGPLVDRDSRLRAAAVRALGVLGTALGRTPLDTLVPRLSDESPEVRWETAFVLGRTGAKAAAAPLAERLADDHAEVRRQAALSLGMLGALEARAALAAMAERDPDQRTRAAAAAALSVLPPR
jgi:HEAT repeat protein